MDVYGTYNYSYWRLKNKQTSLGGLTNCTQQKSVLRGMHRFRHEILLVGTTFFWAVLTHSLVMTIHSYWKLPFIVSFPIENGDFP